MKKKIKEYKEHTDAFFVAEEPLLKYNEAKDFVTLECWKKARLVKLFFYNEVLPLLPESEKFNLNIQIRKSAISITQNIAEGYGRYHFQEAIQFFRISRGELYELKDDIISCWDLKYVSKEIFAKGISLIENAKISLNGYIKYVKGLQKEYK